MECTPIVPWIGGKRRLAERLFKLFPPHECYVEAFAGGAALFFLRPQPASTEVLNDANGDLVNLYRCVQHHLEEFVRQFKWSLTSRQMFKWLQEMHVASLTDIQRAARFFYLQHHAFGGKVVGQSFGTATTGQPVNLLRVEETLSAAHVRLAGVIVEHAHWLECVQRYDRAHTLHYLDPPYWECEGYGLPWEFGEYERMAAFARQAKGKVMISINDHPAIRAVFSGLHTEQTEVRYTVGKVETDSRSPAGELIVLNWQPELMGLF